MKYLSTLGLALVVVGCADVVSSNDGGGFRGSRRRSWRDGRHQRCALRWNRYLRRRSRPEWTGPLALIDSATGCGGEFPDEATVLFDGLQAGAPSCACSCGTATAVCSTQMFAIGFSGLNCVTGQGQQSITESECYNTFSASHSVSLGTASASCGAGTVTASLPMPTWSRSVSTCNGFTPRAGRCDPGQTCVPAPGPGFEAGLCYVQDGDHTCPTDFPNRTLFYSGFSDTRACPSSCSCQGSGASCRVSITGYASADCGSPQGAVTVFSGGETCAAVDSAVVRAIQPGTIVVDNNGTCSPGAVSLSGAVTEDGATTVCCN